MIILFRSENYEELAQDFNRSVIDLSGWFCANELRLNLDKTQTIKFGSYGGEFIELLLDTSERVANWRIVSGSWGCILIKTYVGPLTLNFC